MSGPPWFIDQLRSAVLHPRAFARTLAREHFGLAGVFVALLSGASLSLALDLLVVASRDVDPLAFLPRLITDALFLAVRMAVTIALLGIAASGALRLLHRATLASLDQLVTAMAFATSPFILAFPVALPAALGPLTRSAAGVDLPDLGLVSTVALLLLAAFAAWSLGLDLLSLLPAPLAVATALAVLAASTFAFGDEIARARYVTYRYVPLLAPALAAEPATGTPWTRGGIVLVVPKRWHLVTSVSELGRFETDKDVLTVTTARGGVFLTPGDLADQISLAEVRGMTERASWRDIVRVGDMIVVDDRNVGVYEGRRVALRQFTTVRGTVAYALLFRSIEPADAERSLAEDATIAATWRVGLAAP